MRQKKTFQEIMNENFLNLVIDINLKIQVQPNLRG